MNDRERHRVALAVIFVCYLASLVSSVVWLATDAGWAALFSITIGAAGTILHVAEALYGDGDQDGR